MGMRCPSGKDRDLGLCLRIHRRRISKLELGGRTGGIITNDSIATGRDRAIVAIENPPIAGIGAFIAVACIRLTTGRNDWKACTRGRTGRNKLPRRTIVTTHIRRRTTSARTARRRTGDNKTFANAHHVATISGWVRFKLLGGRFQDTYSRRIGTKRFSLQASMRRIAAFARMWNDETTTDAAFRLPGRTSVAAALSRPTPAAGQAIRIHRTAGSTRIRRLAGIS